MNKAICKKFCWLPTPVYSSPYYRDGFRWMSNVWVGAEGKCYTTALEAAASYSDQERRIAACLGAFEGIPTEEFEGMPISEYVCKQAFVQKMEATGGGAEFQFSGFACQLLAHAFAGQFVDNHPDGVNGNYIELTFHNREIGELVVSMQRKAGKTPGQKMAELEAQRDELLEALREAEAGLSALRENYQRVEGLGFESMAAGTAFKAADNAKAAIARAKGGAK